MSAASGPCIAAKTEMSIRITSRAFANRPARRPRTRLARSRDWAEHWLFRRGRPDLEPGMSAFTPDFDQKDKSDVTDRGRISAPIPRDWG